MDKALLDTDIFSEILKGRNESVARNAIAYRQQFGRYTLSAITVMEVVKGLQQVSRHDHIDVLLSALSAEEVLAFNRETAQIAGRIYGELERTGRPIGRADPMVAAIALQHKLVLVTGNVNHFERIQSLGFPLLLCDWRS